MAFLRVAGAVVTNEIVEEAEGAPKTEGEELVAKLRLEFTVGPEVNRRDHTRWEWDIGLMYLTTKGFWLVNRAKEKFPVPFKSLFAVGEPVETSMNHTKYSEVMKADQMIELIYTPKDGRVSTILLSGPSDVLRALKTHLAVRTHIQPGAYQRLRLKRTFAVSKALGLEDETVAALLAVDPSEIKRMRLDLLG